MEKLSTEATREAKNYTDSLVGVATTDGYYCETPDRRTYVDALDVSTDEKLIRSAPVDLNRSDEGNEIRSDETVRNQLEHMGYL